MTYFGKLNHAIKAYLSLASFHLVIMVCGFTISSTYSRENIMDPATFFLILTLLLVLAALIIPAIQERSKKREG
jgi:hypothetical protein